MEFKDVAHLYLGKELPIIHTNHLGATTTTTLLKVEGLPVIRVLRFPYMSTAGWDEIKPVLRPISDLTADELGKVLVLDKDLVYDNETVEEWVKHWSAFSPLVTLFLLQSGFDLFGLIESGQAIKATE